MLMLSRLNLKRWCIVVASIVGCTVLFIAAVISLWLFPHINDYRTSIENTLSQKIGHSVTIDKISGRWEGLAPTFFVSHLTVSDGHHHLDLPHITLIASWKSLLSFRPRFSLVRIKANTLDLHQHHDQLFLNHLLVKKRGADFDKEGETDLDRVLSDQDRIELDAQAFRWQDNGKKPLVLKKPFVAYTHPLFSQQLIVNSHIAPGLGRGLSLKITWRGKPIPSFKSFNGQLALGAKRLINSGYLSTLSPSIRFQPLSIHDLSAQISWQPVEKGKKITVDELVFTNPDLTAHIQGSYLYRPQGVHTMDFEGDLYRIQAKGVARYFPRQLPKPFLNWFDKALAGGYANHFHFVLRGNPRQFPFAQGRGGTFKGKADIHNGKLHYHSLWPDISEINGHITFHNEKLYIQANSAVTGGATLQKVNVTIPTIVTKKPIVIASGSTLTSLDKLLRYTAGIPIQPLITRFARELHAKGDAQLDLALKIHIRDKKSHVAGRVLLKNNAIDFGALPVPAARQIMGTLYFTEQGIHADNIKLWALNAPLKFNAQIKGRQQLITLSGKVDSQALSKQYIGFLSPYISGKSNYKATIVLADGLNHVAVESSLVGTQLEAPSPAKKATSASWPLKLTVHALPSQHYLIDYTLDGLRANGKVLLKKNGNPLAGAFQFGLPKKNLPSNGIFFDVAADHIELAPWLAMLDGITHNKNQARLPFVATLYTKTLATLDSVFDDVSATLKGNAQGSVSGTIESRQHDIKFNYHRPSATLNANISQLDIDAFSALKGQHKSPLTQLKTIDAHVDALYYRDTHLGQLKLTAQRDSGEWQVKSATLFHPDGAILKAHCRSEPSPDNPHEDLTHALFTFKADNLGALLNSLGYKNLMADGRVQLTGQLYWPGAVWDIEPNHLNGNMMLSIDQGSFLKIEQGISRLLGILSLQSLARHVQGDFSDIFGQGFAFDHIVGEVAVVNGILATQGLSLSGSTADAFLVGTLNLINNTQQLNIRVSPHLSQSTSIAAGLLALNPWLGVVTFLGQSAASNPLEKIWTLTYDISGSIDKPIIKKRSSNNTISTPWNLLSK